MAERYVGRVGILGAGRVGTAIARQALKAGYEVAIATSKPPEDILLIVDFTAPGAVPRTVDDVVCESDFVILALPLGKYRALNPEKLAGRIVIDVMNYWPPNDGTISDFEGDASSSEIIQRYLSAARLVRTLNHIGYHQIEEDARPPGHPERRAVAIAGDDEASRRMVAGFVDRLGFDPVDAGALVNARTFQIGTSIFETPQKKDGLAWSLGNLKLAPEPAI
jgi:8-hydroxy-5-deazaflavin:NADPH oxidoreductase